MRSPDDIPRACGDEPDLGDEDCFLIPCRCGAYLQKNIMEQTYDEAEPGRDTEDQ